MQKKHRREGSTQRSRRQPTARHARPPVQYPIATMAYYGPDDKTVTKIAVGIVESEDAEPIMRRWFGPNVTTNPDVLAQIGEFIQTHGAHQVVMTDGVLGCPHEEGIDFPAGQECPYCPFWRGEQGIQRTDQGQVTDHVTDKPQDADPYQELKTLTRQHMHLVWKSAQLGVSFTGEKARMVKAMREHPEYYDLWERLDKVSDEEIERDGVNPILHVTIHSIVENQIAGGGLKEVGQATEALMRRGLSRHEAIHEIGSALSEEIYHTLKNQRPFDEAAYVRALKKLVR